MAHVVHKRCSEVTSKGEHNEKKETENDSETRLRHGSEMENIFNPHLKVHQKEKRV